jgi:hypothetical protein
MNSSETFSGIKSFYFGFGGTRWGVPWRTEVIGSTRRVVPRRNEVESGVNILTILVLENSLERIFLQRLQ